MTEVERAAKFKELMRNDRFATKLFLLDKPEDAQLLLEKNGVTFSLEEIRLMGRALRMMADKNCELTDDELSDVSGGNLGVVIASALVSAVVAVMASGGIKVSEGWCARV